MQRRIDRLMESSWGRSLWLCTQLLALALVVVPLLRDLPFGATTRSGLLAWMLVALAFYWIYARLGLQPLLIIQMILFSAAALLLTVKGGLVLVGIERFSILRRTAYALILSGAAVSGFNLIGLLLAPLWKSVRRPAAGP